MLTVHSLQIWCVRDPDPEGNLRNFLALMVIMPSVNGPQIVAGAPQKLYTEYENQGRDSKYSDHVRC